MHVDAAGRRVAPLAEGRSWSTMRSVAPTTKGWKSGRSTTRPVPVVSRQLTALITMAAIARKRGFSAS